MPIYSKRKSMCILFKQRNSGLSTLFQAWDAGLNKLWRGHGIWWSYYAGIGNYLFREPRSDQKNMPQLEPISLVFGCRVDLLHQLTLSPERERGNVEQDPGNEVAAAWALVGEYTLFSSLHSSQTVISLLIYPSSFFCFIIHFHFSVFKDNLCWHVRIQMVYWTSFLAH